MSTIIKVTDVSSSVSVSDSTGGVIRVLRVRPTLGGEIVMYSFLGALSTYPTIRPDGAALQEGDYFMHTGTVPEQLAYYGGGVWVLPHEDAEYSNVARLASELARDQSVAAKDESVVAKNESVAAKDESVVAKDDSVTAKLASELARDGSVTAKLASELARDGSVTAKNDSELARDESVAAKDESVTAKLASELARDDSGLARDESVVAKDESVVAKDEAIAAKNEASAIASVSYNRTQYNVVDLISNPSSTYALTGSNFSQGNMLVLVDRATTFNVTASIREPGAEIIIKNVHRANLTIVSDEPFTSGSTSYTVNEAGTLVIKFIELGGELALLPSFSPEPWGEGSTVIHINNDYTVQASDITIGKNLFILVDASEGEYREITLPGLTELQQEGFTINVHVFGGEAALIASPTDPNFPNEILSGTTFVGGSGDGTLHATCIGLSQVGTTSVYKANYATSLTDGSSDIEPSAPSDGNIYGLKDDKWVQVPAGTGGGAAYELTDNDITNATSTSGTVSGEQLAVLGESNGLTGKLEWGTPIPYDLRFPITQPVINGNTWESTTVVGAGGLKGIAYSTLIPQGVYTDFTINMVGSAEARTLLYFNESVPSVEAFESTSISGFYISITGAGVVTFNKNGEKESLATVVGTFPFPISFGLRTATPMSEPTLLVNGTGYTVGASQHTYLSLSSLFEGIVENDSVVVELNPTTKTHEAAEFSSFIGTLDTLPTKFSPLQHNLPESESSLVDNIDSSSITKVSPKKLNSWLVTKQLTPDDIANATANAGMVSGEQLAALGGGGGPEILKDWTFVADANGTISLLGDLVLGASGLDKLTIEYDDLDAANATGWKGVIMVGTETAGGTIYSEIRTQAFNSLGVSDVSVISDGTYPMSPVLSYGNYPVASAKGTLEITERERTNNQIIMIYGEAQTLSSDANGNGMRHNATRYVAGVRTTNTNKINNILFDTSGMGATSFRYRVIRKN